MTDHRVVLVHGLWWGPWCMRLLEKRLQRSGLQTAAFGYPTLGEDFNANARSLAAFVRSLDADAVDLVGHSLGGLVILRMLNACDELPPGRVVLLGSPVHGSSVGRRVARVRPLRPLVGQAKSALDVGFSQAPVGRDTGVIAGSRSVGIGRLFGPLERPNDGTVTVAECRLDGAAECLLPVTHTGLLSASSVAEAAAKFLRCGRFPDQHA